jgi:FkbM family methyltransferase
MKYYSQYKQDKFADLFFKKKHNGFFLDIGAHDGISYSNTYHFEKNRNWSGICIEPIPDVYNNLTVNRNCKCYNVCISEKEGFVTFRRVHGYGEMLSGILDFMTPEHIERINYESGFAENSFEDLKIESKNINLILKDNGINKIDYLSIDTEGAEFAIIRTIDFGSIDIAFLTVENNESSAEVSKYLGERGYSCISSFTDDFYYKTRNQIPFFRLRVMLYKLLLENKDFLTKLKRKLRYSK